MTPHPCKGLSLGARNAFEAISINQPPRCTQKTLDLLLERGLIARDEDKVFRDRFGEMRIPQYYVPLPVHMQFCQWASEQPDVLEESASLSSKGGKK